MTISLAELLCNQKNSINQSNTCEEVSFGYRDDRGKDSTELPAFAFAHVSARFTAVFIRSSQPAQFIAEAEVWQGIFS